MVSFSSQLMKAAIIPSVRFFGQSDAGQQGTDPFPDASARQSG